MLIASNLFINSSFYFILRYLVSKFYSGCLQEVMFGIPWSYCRVNYSKTTSTNNFEIIPEHNLPDAILKLVELKADLLDKYQDIPSNTQ